MKVQKRRELVSVTGVDGLRQTGFVFLVPGQRLSDMVNLAEEFIPFEVDGGFEALNKHAIVRIRPVEPVA